MWDIRSGTFGAHVYADQSGFIAKGMTTPARRTSKSRACRRPLSPSSPPRFDRQELLRRQHAIVTAQTVQDFEWLILDDSPAALRLFRGSWTIRASAITIWASANAVGAKRNWLCEQAAAPVIAQFDDDDYYAPDYLETMLARLAASADIAKLSAWFVYSAQLKRLGWWDTRADAGPAFHLRAGKAAERLLQPDGAGQHEEQLAGLWLQLCLPQGDVGGGAFPPVQYASDYGFVAAAPGARAAGWTISPTPRACACTSCAPTTCPRAFRSICCRISCWTSCSAPARRR